MNPWSNKSPAAVTRARTCAALQEGLEWSGNWKWSVPVCESVSSLEHFVSLYKLYISDTSASSISREMSKQMSAHISTSLLTFLTLTLRPLDLGHGSTMEDGPHQIPWIWQFVAVCGSLWQFHGNYHDFSRGIFPGSKFRCFRIDPAPPWPGCRHVNHLRRWWEPHGFLWIGCCTPKPMDFPMSLVSYPFMNIPCLDVESGF